MAINEDLLDDLISRQVRSLRAMGGVQNDVDRLLRELNRKVGAAVVRIDPNAVTRASARAKREAALAAEIKLLITATFVEINKVVRAALRRMGAAESQSMVTAMRKVLPAEIVGSPKFAPTEVAKEITSKLATQTLVEGTVMRNQWSRLSRKAQNDVTDLIRIGLRDGLSNQRITTTIVGGTLDGVKVEGVLKTTRNNASAIVRTGTNAILNSAREATIQNNLDIVEAIQQVSTLDGRTSDICIAYSGQVWDAKTFEPVSPSTLPYNGGPPRHFNCRSTIIPVLKGGDQFGGVDLSPTTRASMDGEVPFDITFADWLKKKGATFQNDLLGPGKARLWRSGKISLTQLVDMRGNPLTLGQLETLAKS